MKSLANNYQTAWPIALQMLGRRAYSEQEIRWKLDLKGFTRDVIDMVVQGLCERGYLNDSALCSMLFEKYSNGGRYGIRRILHKIKQRGIPDEIISEVVRSYDDSAEWQTALQLVSRRFKGAVAADKMKIGRFLVNRGFSTGIIGKVLDKFFRLDR